MKTYAAIDLKSFYASVECIERNLDPLHTNLVVADIEHSEKTICLAITPSLKAYGIGGRPRLFEVIQKVKEINQQRYKNNGYQPFVTTSIFDSELKENRNAKLDYIIATPQMALYMKYSTDIFKIYTKYVSAQDIHVYSIDEVFIDITSYIQLYNMDAESFVRMLIQDVYKTTGITATAGIGSNLYLCKVAMDIVAKHQKPDENGVRIATLTQQQYQEQLWNHRPITDFWRVGKGYARKLEMYGIHTMEDIALKAIQDEDFFYRLFGIQAEYLIDHAFGYEPCTMKAIKAYRPEQKSICSSQVLHEPYSFQKGRIIVKEMADQLCLELLQKGYETNELTLVIGYDVCNLKDERIKNLYQGEIKEDSYGRLIPKHARGVIHLKDWSQSSIQLRKAILDVYDRIVIPYMYIRKVNITSNKVQRKGKKKQIKIEQYSLFDDIEQLEKSHQQKQIEREKESTMQQVFLNIQQKYGKNSILRGMNTLQEATTKERNQQIGGHRA